MVELNKRLVEVDAVLEHLSRSDYEKIPEELIEAIKQNKDAEYVWIYDETKELKDQNLSRDTISILSYINMKFLLNEKQRNYVQQIFNKNEQKLNEEKMKKYSPNEIFSKKNNDNNTSIIVFKKENWYDKIFNKIKKILLRKR